ncbi:MAG: cyclic pyranopterin monophosphate synthase MoaC [Desulfurococcales archaeon]|nr:cyclic pyranopterin monophosphate synthase MoaC [Desulfurococcales archaeon]MEB3779844.1 cyclic pyranopterin monophosphate synthase MoaC [Desulfurococcales archaeon]
MPQARMIDITSKPIVYREAIASGRIYLKEDTVKAIREGKIEKGDVEQVATVAAILAAKKTPEILPLCHPIPLTSVKVDYRYGDNYVEVTVKVKANAKTGVEMEALTSVSAALLTIWDMVKQYEKDEKGQYPTTFIKDIRVIEKIKSS